MEMIACDKDKIPTYVEGKTVISGSYEDVMTIIAGLGDFQKDIVEGYRYSYSRRSYYDIETGKSLDSYSRGTLDKSNKECFSFVKLNPKPLTEDTTELYFRAGKRDYLDGGNLRLVQFCIGFLVLLFVGVPIFLAVIDEFSLNSILFFLGSVAFCGLWLKLLFYTRRKSYSPETQMKLFESSIVKHINWQLGLLQKAKEKLKSEEEKLEQH